MKIMFLRVKTKLLNLFAHIFMKGAQKSLDFYWLSLEEFQSNVEMTLKLEVRFIC
jgi:hypothetical protein